MTALTLYGKPTYSYTVLRNSLDTAIKEAELDVHLSEIHDTNDIVSRGISKIPSVSINENLHPLANEAIQSYTDKIILYLLEMENFGSLSRIIVPVNNASPSLHGLIYAQQLSKNLPSVVTAVNYMDQDVQSHIIADSVHGYNDATDTDFARNLNLLRDDHNLLPVQSKFIAHNPSQLIINMANERENNLVILGYDKESGMLDGLEYRQLEKIDCPIFLVANSYTDDKESISHINGKHGLDTDKNLIVSSKSYPVSELKKMLSKVSRPVKISGRYK